MNKTAFEKRSRYRFLLLSSLLVVLIASLLVATFRSENTSSLNTIISELSQNRKEAAQVENAIRLLYSAENNFRTFVLTGNKENFRLYAGEINWIEKIFYDIETNFGGTDQLPGLFKDKKEKTDLFIHARLLADSLMKNATSWDTTSVYSGFFTDQYKPQTAVVNRVDTVISISKQNESKKRKLLGRIRDAISSKKATDTSEEVKVVKSSTTSSQTQETGSEVLERKLARRNMADLRAMTLSLKRKEFELLESNNRLFAEMKEFLDVLSTIETKAANDRKEHLSSDAGSSLENLTRYNIWQFAVIMVLIACVAATLFWIYRNDLKLIRDARKAKLYAKLKTEFVATTSHEIRSPIYVMQLYAEQLALETMPSGIQEMVDGLTNSSKLTLAIVNQILDTMEVEHNLRREEIFYPKRTISQVISALGIFSNQKGTALTIDTGLSSEYALIGDEFRLKQVLINLISNSFKFTEKGSITVKCSVADDSDKDIAWLKISVVDTGAGIPDKYLETVFEQFSYLNVSDESAEQMKSNGLGLYIVKNIIEEHQGRINVSSKVGEGSAFTFEIPYKKAVSNTHSDLEASLV
jgi:two-component system, sensor histidine kinase